MLNILRLTELIIILVNISVNHECGENINLLNKCYNLLENVHVDYNICTNYSLVIIYNSIFVSHEAIKNY